ncbi:uncharacterized protein BN660_00754 [Clostridium sp. CAG:448]|nr:uncharacterized protein BN660_00754 [Clostridium sp. CAG:448]
MSGYTNQAEKTGEGKDIRNTLLAVADTIENTGSDPVCALAGYLLSEDPSYIPVQNGARRQMAHLDRDMVLTELIRAYLRENQG